jgi:hypothetical protein
MEDFPPQAAGNAFAVAGPNRFIFFLTKQFNCVLALTTNDAMK